MYSRKHGVISLSVSGFSLFDWLEDLSAGKQSTLGRPSAHQAWDHEPGGHNQRTYIYVYTLKKINISFVRMDKPWRLIQLMTFAIPAQLTLLLCKATKTALGDCHAKVQQYLKKSETKFHNQPRPYFTVVQLLDNS